MKAERKEEDILRLPRWAQDLIERERANVLYWKDKALSAASEAGDTDVVIEEFRGTESFDHGLPRGTRVTFKLGGEREDRVDVSVKQDYDGVRYLEVMGRGTVAVHPRASNVIHIYDDDDRRWREKRLRNEVASKK